MDKQLHKIRHSLSHLMASAVLQLFPDAKLAIGPVIANGFYYDFDLPRPFTPQDLPRIEKRMKKLASQNIAFKKNEKDYSEAIAFSKKDPYKLELIQELKKEKAPITYFQSGKFIDLCSGPHVATTKEIPADAFKLTKTAGAYWRGDEKNTMLQRIYGVAFNTKKELDDYLKLQEELKKRDHRKLGKELELFAFHEVAPGAPFWLPKGMIIIKELEKYWRKIHDQNEYLETSTPILNKKTLWEKSGHWQHYAEDIFRLKVDDQEYALKPMNCPGSTYIYSSKLRSYKDLPLRLSEIGRLHRNELSGALGGLFRVRQITMDDAHIYCRPDQIEQEITGVIKLIKPFYKIFNFQPSFALSTRPKKYIGEIKKWDYAEKALAQALTKNKISYKVNEGDGAFYGPKIDIIIKDSLSRAWQLATIQLDFQIPERFELSYTDQHGSKQTPVIIHRAVFGSFERFMGILIEHYAGSFPVWLSPTQVKIMTVGKAHVTYAKKLHQQFLNEGIRSELDDANDTVGYKIRLAEKQKIPYMLVIGDKEMKSKSLNIRLRGQKDIKKMTQVSFIKQVLKEIEDKK
ncbi:threonine--tRNA ligase [Patescibacteria group bacterium]|nr:threonine--tRNA ligase [Patescibacteria group bacterium]MBU0964099.1 threonine--tRNA ligase [Patescibacteria group bacterium]